MKVIWNIIRDLFMFIDYCVYGIVTHLLQLIFDLANTEIFSQTTINQFARRIYVILGLVMLFKIIMSFFQILVNPDSLNDKEKGAGNVLKRVIISFTLIVLVPSIFRFARQLQNYIMPIIPKVLLGVSSNEDEKDITDNMESIGERMAWYSFVPFFQYNNNECATGEIVGLPSTVENPGNIDRIGTMGDAWDKVNVTDGCSTNEYGYKYEYRFLLSTVVGAYLVYVLVNVAVKIAIRAIKLSICEFAAPIPIASYVDAKASKNSFDKWVSTSLKIYADLFIHLITVYFILFVFLTIFQEENLTQIYANLGGGGFRSVLVTLFIITGLLTFAKDAPKFLSDLLGLKVDGMGGIFKTDGWKALGGTVGAGLGAIGSGVGNAVYSWKNGDKAGAAFRGLAGLTSGTARGLKAAADGKGIKGSFIENVRTTTGNSQKRVNKRAIVNASEKDYDEKAKPIIDDYKNEISKYNKEYDDTENRLRDQLDFLKSKRAEMKRNGWLSIDCGDGAGLRSLNALENDINEINNQISANREARKNDTRYATAREQMNKDLGNVPKSINPTANFWTNALNSAIGMSSTNASSILEASNTLSSLRSSYYTGEAMKKLSEEGSELKEVLSMGATYSEVASAYESLRNGKVDRVVIGGVPYDSSNLSALGEQFKKAEKEAAINYINAVRKGKIKNTTLEEGFKQVEATLEGLNIDIETKKKLIADFNNSDGPGDFFKSLSDVSKRLETEGKRRQAYEREQQNSQ